MRFSAQLSLQQAKVESTERYESLLKAIEEGRSRSADPLANSSSSIQVPDHMLKTLSLNPEKQPTYEVVDKNGLNVALSPSFGQDKELTQSLEKLSELIDQVEEAQNKIGKATQLACIWEVSVEDGVN